MNVNDAYCDDAVLMAGNSQHDIQSIFSAGEMGAFYVDQDPGAESQLGFQQ